ncbi:hypothetical protein ASJ33_05175 [Dehalococcoides mccartyi]|uniref:DUF1643 domain-containing protein n=1 Tax=Dehalococcoides mccartyi TaxID=61435 RepID=A0A0V8M0L3_9CHLR|nr:DUF1643 domain-containing protein [Dehalococcoides mccartyi]APH12585.1 hypothetical protein ASJ33_05175 [Dehalococcoides mccartyi]KSV17318.1 hypothetical protein DA01_07795 [Dehalococcoides mccartyi]
MTELMHTINLQIPAGAIFTDDRRYRYVLWRVHNPNLPMLGVVCLNPSTANETMNDPTVTRLSARVNKFYSVFGGFIIVNLFGLVSANPQILLNNPDAIGEMNDYFIMRMVSLTKCQLCGWGSFKPVKYRDEAVYSMLSNPVCLGINKDGQPKHPLYISYTTPIVEYHRGEVTA